MEPADELRFNLPDAASIAGTTPKAVRAIVRAGIPLTDPKSTSHARYDEIDCRVIAICAAFMRDLSISALEAVEFWNALMPTGGWCIGRDPAVTFSVDGNPRIRISAGAIASQVARRIQAYEVAAHDMLRLAEAGSVAFTGDAYSDVDKEPRISKSTSLRQTKRVVIPPTQFHPQRLTNRAPKPKGHRS